MFIPRRVFPATDPCTVNNGGCEHKCVSIGGQHRCECPRGQRLGTDGRSCIGRAYGNTSIDNIVPLMCFRKGVR